MNRTFKSNLCLLGTALIWGFALVAQRDSMSVMGPFMYNAIRMFLGSAALVPVFIISDRIKRRSNEADKALEQTKAAGRTLLKGGIIAGVVIFLSMNLQQVALVSTDAGKTAFITALYIVLVPILGIFLKRRTNINNWIGAGIGAAGLFFLCVKSDFTVATGDILLLAGSLGWAVHIFIIDYFAPKVNAAKLISVQFFIAGLLSLTVALITETNTIEAVISSIPSLLYTGIMSSGIGYTLQTVGQKYAKPTTASIILSTESLFGALAGFVFLNEVMSGREFLGCGLMMTAIIIAQLPARKKLMAQAEVLK